MNKTTIFLKIMILHYIIKQTFSFAALNSSCFVVEVLDVKFDSFGYHARIRGVLG